MSESFLCNTKIIAGSISATIILSTLLSMLIMYWSEKNIKYISASKLLNLLWIIGIIFIIFLSVTIIFTKEEGLTTALAPIGIILAAFIASASVIRSIESTKKLKSQDDIKNKDNQFRFVMTICIHITGIYPEDSLDKKFKTELISNDELLQMRGDFNTTYDLWQKLIDEKYIPWFSNTNSYTYFLETSRAFKQISLAIKSAQNNEKVPMLVILKEFKFYNDSIQLLSKNIHLIMNQLNDYVKVHQVNHKKSR